MKFNTLSFRALSVPVAMLAAVSLLVCSGCGGSKAERAQTPPPQTLSEPVRPQEPKPAKAPAPAKNETDSYMAQKPGQSRELPMFKDPGTPQKMIEPQPIQVTARPPAPAPAPAPAAAATPAPNGGKYHTLAKGETLYAISRQYNVKPKDIIAANNFKDPNKLTIGTKVYIPAN